VTACAACRGPLPEIRKYQNTCSDNCHEAYLFALEAYAGDTKRIVDTRTGITHLVPTRYIAEHGLRRSDLERFPRDDDD
jgi:hypothetical protein